MSWFRRGLSPHQTALAMIGAKAGDRALVIGAADGRLAAALALVTGLNGHTAVVDASADALRRVESAAAKAGALVEIDRAPATMLPLDANAFDVVVVQGELAKSPETGTQALTEAGRVVRPGGRVVVIETARRGGLFAALPTSTGPALPPERIRDWLTQAGLRAARVLAETTSHTFVEAIKPRQ